MSIVNIWMVDVHTVRDYMIRKILCFFGIHKMEKYKPYPTIYPECEIDRCKHCKDYNWR